MDFVFLMTIATHDLRVNSMLHTKANWNVLVPEGRE